MKGSLSRKTFFKLAKLSTGGQHKVLTGLDNISQRFGVENFGHLKALVLRIVDMEPDTLAPFKAPLTEKIEEFEWFLRSDYKSHLQLSSPCGAHCLTRLLGGQPFDFVQSCSDCAKKQSAARASAHPCAACKTCVERLTYSNDCPESCGDHTTHCSQCDEYFHIFAEIHFMLDIVRGRNPSDMQFYAGATGTPGGPINLGLGRLAMGHKHVLHAFCMSAFITDFGTFIACPFRPARWRALH